LFLHTSFPLSINTSTNKLGALKYPLLVMFILKEHLLSLSVNLIQYQNLLNAHLPANDPEHLLGVRHFSCHFYCFNSEKLPTLYDYSFSCFPTLLSILADLSSIFQYNFSFFYLEKVFQLFV